MCVVVPFDCLVIHHPLHSAPVLPLFTGNRYGLKSHLLFLTGGMTRASSTIRVNSLYCFLLCLLIHQCLPHYKLLKFCCRGRIIHLPEYSSDRSIFTKMTLFSRMSRETRRLPYLHFTAICLRHRNINVNRANSLETLTV